MKQSARTAVGAYVALLASVAAFPTGASEGPPPQLLETIVITGAVPSGSDAGFETRHTLAAEVLESSTAMALDTLVRQLPSVHVPTNSRGESIAFVRNAAERQVAVFYDGASINIPWDNRLDLSLFPAGLAGTMRTAAGPLAPHYGVNALGAISLASTSARDGGSAAMLGGSQELRDLRASLAYPFGAASSVALGGSYASEDGQPLTDPALLPFSQPGTAMRTNTDRRLGSLHAHGHFEFDGQQLSVTALHVDARKGVAPEGDRASGARFWRYPAVGHSLVVASLMSPLGASTTLNSAAWYQHVTQRIDAYTNVSYAVIGAREENRDDTYGLRELLALDAGRARWVASFNLLESHHDQRDITFTTGAPPASLPAALDYNQRNWSAGGELEYRASRTVVVELGFGYDKVDYLATGDKPPIDDMGGWTGRAGLVWSVAGDWRLRAALGRKLRVPTMRELFGQALNRFLVNPDLQPERIVTAEIAAEWQAEHAGFYAIPFYQDLAGTIDQHNVGALRQRINLTGSRVAGIEVGGRCELGDWSLSSELTWAEARRLGVSTAQTDRLAEKPDLQANLRIAYAPPSGLMVAVEAEHVGSAYSANAVGVLVLLRQSTSVNLQAGYRAELGFGTGELFLQVDNLTNAFIEPQLGLPAPGRWLRGGVRLRW